MIPIVRDVRWRELLPGQSSELRAIDLASGRIRIILSSHFMVIEAPNWSPDGDWIVFTSAGELWRTRADGSGGPTRIDTGAMSDFNNDHVISPDCSTLYASNERDGHLYRLPLTGGEPERISPERDGPFGYFAIGVSPDGRTLGVTGGEPRAGHPFVSNLFLLATDGSALARLTDEDFDSIGCTWSRDGEWRYFSSERDARRPGHSQLYRARSDLDDASTVRWERLTDDDRVDWFPKPSPTGDLLVWLSFEPGTVGHEANVPVRLCSMRPDGSEKTTLCEFIGGQGTMNVSTFSPAGQEFAFVAYPFDQHQEDEE